MLESILSTSLHLLAISMSLGGTFTTLLGTLTVFYWCKAPKAPNDSTNRINNIKGWWLGMTNPQLLGNLYEEFQQDVLEALTEINPKKGVDK